MNCIPNCCRFYVLQAKETLINSWNSEQVLKTVETGMDVIATVGLSIISLAVIVQCSRPSSVSIEKINTLAGVFFLYSRPSSISIEKISTLAGAFFLFYSNTLTAYFGWHNLIKPFITKTAGWHTFSIPVEYNRIRVIREFSLGVLSSFAILFGSWCLVYLAPEKRKIFYSLTAYCGSVFFIDKISGPFFQKSFELFFGFRFVSVRNFDVFNPQNQLQPDPQLVEVQPHDDEEEGEG